VHDGVALGQLLHQGDELRFGLLLQKGVQCLGNGLSRPPWSEAIRVFIFLILTVPALFFSGFLEQREPSVLLCQGGNFALLLQAL